VLQFFPVLVSRVPVANFRLSPVPISLSQEAQIALFPFGFCLAPFSQAQLSLIQALLFPLLLSTTQASLSQAFFLIQNDQLLVEGRYALLPLFSRPKLHFHAFSALRF
jgi:hypothetical protein